MTKNEQPPSKISDTMLMAYLSGDCSEAMNKHIEASGPLMARVRDLARWEVLLTAAYQEINCPSSSELLLYQNALLDTTRSEAIKHHLIQSTTCGCLAELQTLAAIAPPETKVPVSERLWERLQSIGKQIIETFELLEPPQPTQAMRGDYRTRRIIRANDYLVILILTPPLTMEDSWGLEGQISRRGQVGPELEGRAEVFLKDELVAADRVDDLGYFAMSEIPAGNLNLLIYNSTSILTPIRLEL